MILLKNFKGTQNFLQVQKNIHYIHNVNNRIKKKKFLGNQKFDFNQNNYANKISILISKTHQNQIFYSLKKNIVFLFYCSHCECNAWFYILEGNFGCLCKFFNKITQTERKCQPKNINFIIKQCVCIYLLNSLMQQQIDFIINKQIAKKRKNNQSKKKYDFYEKQNILNLYKEEQQKISKWVFAEKYGIKYNTLNSFLKQEKNGMLKYDHQSLQDDIIKQFQEEIQFIFDSAFNLFDQNNDEKIALDGIQKNILKLFKKYDWQQNKFVVYFCQVNKKPDFKNIKDSIINKTKQKFINILKERQEMYDWLGNFMNLE